MFTRSVPFFNKESDLDTNLLTPIEKLIRSLTSYQSDEVAIIIQSDNNGFFASINNPASFGEDTVDIEGTKLEVVTTLKEFLDKLANGR